MKFLATLTLGGSAGMFSSRVLKENANLQWSELRKKLKQRYSDVADPAFALEKFRRTHQNKGESIQNYAERLRAAAAEAV